MLSLRAEPDGARPLGHARVVVEGMAEPPADARFCIRREGYPEPNLGLRGWQVREERLSPLQAAAEGGDTVLVVGPAVTRHLEPGPYVFALPAAGVEQALFWPDTIDVYDGDPLPETPAPAPEPAPVIVAPSAAAPPPPPPQPAPPIATAPLPPVRSAPPPAPAAEPGRGRTPALLGLGALLLAALGGGAWWLSSRETPPPAAPQAAAPPAPPVVAAAPPAPPAPTWPEGTDGLTLREVVERAPDAAGIHAAALRRQAAGRHDDALVLFEEAGERGHAPALTALARLYDPNGFVPGKPFRNPDPRAAARYYRDAAQRGDAGAAVPRAALRASLEEQARAGNGTAETALREFWP